MVNSEKYWYALYTKVNQEFKTAEQLAKRAIEYYLPTVTKIKQWSDRKKKITEPVIKGYIFIYADETERLDAVTIPSVVRYVSEYGKPAKIPPWQIENLKLVIESKSDFILYDGLVPGQTIEILNGPFKGIKGIIQLVNKNMNLVISIEILNRSLIIQLPEGIDYRKCCQKPGSH